MRRAGSFIKSPRHGAAEVDVPIRTELDLIKFAQASSDRTPRAVENAGDKACTLVLHAKKRSAREIVTLHLNTRGPTASCGYDIVDQRGGQKVPGQAVTHFVVRTGPDSLAIEAVFTAKVCAPIRRIEAILKPDSEQDPLGSDCLVAGKS